MGIINRLPGTKTGSTVRNAVVVFGWAFIFMGVMGACLGGADETSDDDPGVEASEDKDDLEDADASADESDDDASDGSDDGGDGDSGDGSGTSAEDSDNSDSSGDSSSASYDGAQWESEASAVYEAQTGGTWIDYDAAGGILEVATNAHGDQQRMAGEIGTVGGTFAHYATHEDAEGVPDTLTVYVYGDSGGTQLNGHYTIEREWAEAYANGEMSSDEFAGKVFATIETY